MLQPLHELQQELLFFFFSIKAITNITIIAIIISKSQIFIQYTSKNKINSVIYTTPTSIMIILTIYATSHAIKHCQNTRAIAHFVPSSRFTEATAATQGV